MTLNAEFSNILDNALAVISPLTGTLDADSNAIINIGAAGTDFSGSGGLTLADALVMAEASAPTTAANQAGFYPAANVGVTELYMRGESNGTATLITSSGMTGLNAGLRGYIGGLTLSIDTDTDHDINVTAGQAADSTAAQMLTLTSEMTKQIDVTWAAGDDAGGMFTGSVTTDTWYHFFLIQKDSDGSIDAGFDTSVTAANIPTGYTKYRRIGSVLTDGSSNIVGFTQVEDEFLWDVPVQDVASSNPGTSAVSNIVSTPSGVQMLAILSVSLFDGTSTADLYVLVTSLDQTDTAPTSSNFTFQLATDGGGENQVNSVVGNWRTNTGNRVRTRISGSDGDVVITIHTMGWIDSRGRFD